MSLKALTDGAEKPPIGKGSLRVYSMNYCPYAHRTRLVLEAKKIQYETVNISLASKPKWFVEMNPLGQVPVLEKDDKVVYESLFITNYYKVIRSQGKDEEAVNEYLSGSEPIEEALAERGNFFAGDRPGMLDYNLWPFYERIGVIFQMVEGLEAKFKGKYPRVTSWVKGMLDDRAVKAVWRPVEKHMAFYQSFLDGALDCDV